MPFGFPSGRDLLWNIIRDLGNPKSDICGILTDCGFRRQLGEFRRVLTLAGPPSIDALLESRPEFLEMGKLAIACSLLPSEQSSQLFGLPETSWYHHLYWRVAEKRPEEIRERKLSIVTFNYDRSLEQFLFTALQNRWGLSDAECRDLMTCIPIVHVYGQLGELPQLADGATVPYGADLNADVARRAAGSIQILHEADNSSERINQARKLLLDAPHVCFLGFGYYKTNLERLAVHELTGSRYIIGSAFALLEGERLVARKPFKGVGIDFGNADEKDLSFLRARPILI